MSAQGAEESRLWSPGDQDKLWLCYSLPVVPLLFLGPMLTPKSLVCALLLNFKRMMSHRTKHQVMILIFKKIYLSSDPGLRHSSCFPSGSPWDIPVNGPRGPRHEKTTPPQLMGYSGLTPNPTLILSLTPAPILAHSICVLEYGCLLLLNM